MNLSFQIRHPWFTPGADGRTITEFREPEERAEGEPFRPTAIMEKILQYLQVNGTANTKTLRGLGKSQYVDQAIKIMVEESTLIMTVRGQSHQFSLTGEAQ